LGGKYNLNRVRCSEKYRWGNISKRARVYCFGLRQIATFWPWDWGGIKKGAVAKMKERCLTGVREEGETR
jgi:hypothetical protein